MLQCAVKMRVELLYKRLVAAGTVSVRAYVRDADKARKVLGCHKCDASEGIFVGNVSDEVSLRAATLGARAVLIAVGVSGSEGDKSLLARPTPRCPTKTRSTCGQCRVYSESLPSMKRAVPNTCI